MTTLALLGTACSAIQGPGMSPQRHVLHPSAERENQLELRMLQNTSNVGAVTEDAIVRVVGNDVTCTGTLIEDDLVLTAHHCLVERGAHGEYEKKLLEPSAIRVEIGGDYFAWGEVGIKHIVTPPCGEAGGNGDIAVLVLTRKLVGLATMTPRLEAPPKLGEDALTMGFGRCALSGDAIKRKSRDGGPIRALSGETLSMDAAVCPGDSGGPVFAKGARDVIGVVSLSAMDHDERTRGASVMARLDAYRPVFSNAHAIAQGMSPQELPPLECAAASVPKPKAK